MAKMNFSTNTNLGKLREQNRSVLVALGDMIPSNENFYSLTKLEETAVNISVNGVLDNFVLMESEHGDGKYIILSGNRRFASIQYGKANGIENMPSKVECKILPYIADELTRKFKLASANGYREKSDAEKVQEIRIFKEYYEREIENGNIKQGGRIREMIANEMGVSPSVVGFVEYIDKHAVEEVQNKLDSGEYSLNLAYEVSHLDEEEQRDVVENVEPKDVRAKTKEIRERQKKKWEEKTDTNENTETVTEQNVPEGTVEIEMPVTPIEEKSEETPRQEHLTVRNFLDCFNYVVNGFDFSEEQKNVMSGISIKLERLLEKSIEEILDTISK